MYSKRGCRQELCHLTREKSPLPEVTMKPIGIVRSCFKEKFGIPRQAGLVPEAKAVIEMLAPYDRDEAFRGLDGFSHIWVIFLFHATARTAWKSTVRPPRLGGNERIGVFASRSTFRPNPIGMSVVRFEGLRREGGKLVLDLAGVDLLDGTPVLDIKPYLPYADTIPGAVAGYASEPPQACLSVEFSACAGKSCQEKEALGYTHLRRMIVSLLQTDPRPAYSTAGQQGETREYGMRLYDFDLKWVVDGNRITVTSLEKRHPED